jgi:hypothetical protein
MNLSWSEDRGSRGLVHGVEELCLNRSGNGVGQSRESDSRRESVWHSGGGSDNGKGCLASFFLLSLLLGLVLFVANSLGHDIGQKLEVVYAGDCTGCERVSNGCWCVGKGILTDVFVLNVSSGLLLGLDDILTLFNEVL